MYFEIVHSYVWVYIYEVKGFFFKFLFDSRVKIGGVSAKFCKNYSLGVYFGNILWNMKKWRKYQ